MVSIFRLKLSEKQQVKIDKLSKEIIDEARSILVISMIAFITNYRDFR